MVLGDIRQQRIGEVGAHDQRLDLSEYERKRMNRAWEQRLSMTPSEEAMAAILVDSIWTWWPQTPIGNWIVDFYCAELQIVLEVDGGYHNQPSQVEWDTQRDDKLVANGYTVVRFLNEHVEQYPEQVAYRLAEICDAQERRR